MSEATGKSFLTATNKSTALWAAILVSHSAVTAFIARATHVPYADFSISELALYSAAGFFICKASQSVRTAVIGAAFVALMDSTVGRAALTAIGPGGITAHHALLHPITISSVVLTAAFFAWTGALLYVARRRLDKPPPH